MRHICVYDVWYGPWSSHEPTAAQNKSVSPFEELHRASWRLHWHPRAMLPLRGLPTGAGSRDDECLWASAVPLNLLSAKTLETSQSHNCYNRPSFFFRLFKLYPPLSAEKNPQMQDELNHLPLTTAEFRRSSPLVSSSGAAPSNWRGWARRHRIRKARVW